MRNPSYAVELAESVDALGELNRSIMAKFNGEEKYREVYDWLCWVSKDIRNAWLCADSIAEKDRKRERRGAEHEAAG